jgi:hypothetical protein
VRSDESQVEAWITLARPGAAAEAVEKPMKQLVMRGGCDLAALSHYLVNSAESAVLELLTGRDERQIRIDHSALLQLALSDVDPETARALEAIGYAPSDWTSALKAPQPEATWFLSFWTEAFCTLYRHKSLGFCVPYLLPVEPYAAGDITRLRPDEVAPFLKSDLHRAQHAYFLENFECLGCADEATVRSAMRRLRDRALPDTQIFVVLGPESWLGPDGKVIQRPEEQRVNRWIRGELEGRAGVRLVQIADFVEPGKRRSEPLHFDRLTYKRAADAVLQLVRAQASSGRTPALVPS